MLGLDVVGKGVAGGEEVERHLERENILHFEQ
jgi:hypothetical protein